MIARADLVVDPEAHAHDALAALELLGILGAHATRVVLSSDTIKMALYDVGVGGAVNLTTDDFWNDRSTGLVGTAYTLANKTVGSVAAAPLCGSCCLKSAAGTA